MGKQVLIQYRALEEDPNKARITYIHYLPELLSEEEKASGVLVEGYEEPAEKEGYASVSFYLIKEKQIIHEYIERAQTNEKEAPSYATVAKELEVLREEAGLITAQEMYDRTPKSDDNLFVLKELKISALKQQCEKAIFDGFFSQTTEAWYGFKMHDQMNFTQMLFMMAQSKPEYIDWKTDDKGIVRHTPAEFQQIIMEAEQHKRDCIGKQWVLRAQVEKAESVEQLEQINWYNTLDS